MQNNQQGSLYYLQRPGSPKHLSRQPPVNKNTALSFSIGANQSPTNLLPPRSKGEEGLEEQLRLSSQQNQKLREENAQLRQQLMRLRRDACEGRSFEKVSLSPSFSDLRGTIKKERELGQLRELRSKVQILSSQCRTNEEIIGRLEDKTRKLSLELSRKQQELEDLRPQIARLDSLREKTATVGRLYNDLENKFNQQQLDWMRWKQNWLAQKEYYLQQIRELEFSLEKRGR